MADGVDTADGCQPEDFKEVATLLKKVERLQQSNQNLQKEKKILEDEFGKKRAVFRELYVIREEELKKERELNKVAREDLSRMKAEMEKVRVESDGVKAAAAFCENDQQEEIKAIHSKYQEEIASLQHIMKEAILEAKHASAQQYELEQRNLIAKNQKLERQVQEMKELLSRNAEEGSRVQNVLSAVTEAVTKRRSVGPGGSQSDAIASKEGDRKQLETSMKKAQENAEAWRAVVLPLEEEILGLKSKLEDAEERIQLMDAKLKNVEETTSESGKSDNGNKKDLGSLEDLEEKVKDLTQYLESERSSRTDLEMYVSVLNTQKGVLQEDAEKLKKELQNVCRLLEQEKTAHLELKQTWQMANNQFLEVQRMQDLEYRRLYSLLEMEQKQKLEELKKKGVMPGDEADVGSLIDLESSGSSPATPNFTFQGTSPPLNLTSGSSSQWDSIDTVPCTNTVSSVNTPAVHRETERAHSDTESDKKTENLRRAHSASDVSLEGLAVAGTEVLRAKSADVLGTVINTSGASTPEDVPDGGMLLVAAGNQLSPAYAKKAHGGKIDWKGFEEQVKSSHEERACAMCVNYESQLQNVQGEKQKYHNLANNLQKELEQEKKGLFDEQRIRIKLEEAVTNSAEDAQSQISTQTSTVVKLERLLRSLQENFELTKQESCAQISKLLKSRDAFEVELERLRADYGALQDSALHQLTQMESDSRIAEMKEQLLQIRAVSESTEESLRNEILFLKDRAMAEQVEKDSLEEMFQSEVENMKKDIINLKSELQKEKASTKEVNSELAAKEQSLKNIETVIVALRAELDETMEERGKLEEECGKLKTQLQSRNQQLNESEQNQRDFVKLSQSLQMQIAEIQESQTEVRWEHEDDVSKCKKCQQPLRTNKEKHHCDHCGKIFCNNCLSNTICSGTNKRKHRVCESCFAALSKDANSTYFNTTLADENR